ncbi:MAG: class D sortase [Candidatus Berkelbacteria bacterium]|nr:class D sortase [Candidatus Berkelbacteria bacterium]
MKIDEDDLKKLFEKEDTFEKPDTRWEGFSEPVKISRFRGDELKQVRRKIKKIIHKKPKNELLVNYIDPILRFLAFAGISGFIIFTLINFPGLSTQFRWLYFTEYLGREMPKKISSNTGAKVTPIVTPTPDVVKPPSYFPEVKNEEGNYIKIDRIALNAPIIWDVGENDILDQLKNGVVHYAGTSHPGEGGNIFIVGHSSNYFWINSQYNSVFALLDKLEKGDRIEIKKGGTSYYYDVSDKKAVKPEEVDVLKNTNKELLTLMTCWPIGTSLERLIVQSELVYTSN